MKDLNQVQLESATNGVNSLILFYIDWCYYGKSLIPIFENSEKPKRSSRL